MEENDQGCPNDKPTDPGPTSNADDQAKQLFDEASEMPPEGRSAFLDARCRGDAELRKTVESLLKAHDEAGAFFASPTSAAPPEDSAAGQRVGRYKLLQRIGEGGFGTVYMAEQETPVRRRVALKIIKLGMDTKAVIARFEAERQALAMMDHPNIATVFDAGATETGRPYFVMELVHGIPITEYCDTNNLSMRDRLELFVPVCRAVQHAHQKGIVHRDIKPTNVLVTLHDGVPVPKVIDFGIAKATASQLTEKTLFTEFRQFVGTPAYMSPEQAQMSGLDIVTRSDIYALGVLLYVLLTGTTPFDAKALRSAAYAEIQRIIREDEPPKPSTRISLLGETLAVTAAHRGTDSRKLSQLMRGELDWIVMKCMEKDRTRRYETAAGVAADIQRYLCDEVVEASPPSTTYKLRKLARRYRRPLRVVMVFAILLIVATIFSTWEAVRATRAGAAAMAEKKRADDEAAISYRFAESLHDAEAWYARGQLYLRLGRTDQATADLAKARAQVSGKPKAQDALAWHLATSVDPQMRDPKAAVDLAEQAVAAKPDDDNFWNTLGVAEYRAGNCSAAVRALNKSMELRKGFDGFNGFFMAMANYQLGKRDEARLWNDRAVRWTNAKPRSEELHRFQDEAEALIGPASKTNPASQPAVSSLPANTRRRSCRTNTESGPYASE